MGILKCVIQKYDALYETLNAAIRPEQRQIDNFFVRQQWSYIFYALRNKISLRFELYADDTTEQLCTEFLCIKSQKHTLLSLHMHYSNYTSHINNRNQQ